MQGVARKQNTPVLKINKTLGNQFTSIVKKDTEQTNVAICFYSVGEDSKKAEIAELLSVVSGVTRTSRLYNSHPRRDGCVLYSVYRG